MDEKSLKNTDRRPKRRKDKYNPYNLYTIGVDTDSPHYFIAFTDSQKNRQCLEIDRKLFETFDSFELKDLSFLNEFDNHYEHSELTEASLNRRAVVPCEAVDEIVFRQLESEKLDNALRELPAVQRRRVMLYYFVRRTYREIADMEGCKYQTIQDSVTAALKKLKNFLKK